MCGEQEECKAANHFLCKRSSLRKVNPCSDALVLIVSNTENCEGIKGKSHVAGMGIEEILAAVVKRVPPPQETIAKPPRALIFDSFYDQYLGIVCQFRVMDGVFTNKDTVQFMNTGKSHSVTDMWIRAPDRVDVDSLSPGEVGCLAGAMKTVQVRLPVASHLLGDSVTAQSMLHTCTHTHIETIIAAFLDGSF